MITWCNAKAKQIKTKKKKNNGKSGGHTKALLIISTSNSSFVFVLGFKSKQPNSFFLHHCHKQSKLWCHYNRGLFTYYKYPKSFHFIMSFKKPSFVHPSPQLKVLIWLGITNVKMDWMWDFWNLCNPTPHPMSEID